MAQRDPLPQEPVSPSDSNKPHGFWRKIMGQKDTSAGVQESSKEHPAPNDEEEEDDDEEEADPRAGLIRRVSRKVVPGLPRAQTFKRQQSELRDNLEPHEPTPAERRAVSVDRRAHASIAGSQTMSNPRTSAPDFMHNDFESVVPSLPSVPQSPIGEKMMDSIGDLRNSPEALAEEDLPHVPDTISLADAASMTTSQYDALIHEELEHLWILNLSMHFRDKSKREKFFVTYRERDTLWRRVTISLDYRNAPDNSLEMDLLHTKFQRDKSAKIYEAIRESLVDIQFYDTVTNLKLQTTDGRLHVHVVEDVNEIIHYPTVRMISHLRCRRIKEQDIEFDSHMSGFVYKVRVNGETLIKKEIPGPDTVDEFLYEINALNRLRHSHNVIRFYGVIVDDHDEYVKGLLIDYAEQGALIDVIFDHDHLLSWSRRERWARQIVEGLSEIHEAGFVQGDFTLSNIVIDDDDNAKIIDINRRGCPVGWEPPEATPLIESNQRISMYIGVKSDLYQLGMVLWALAAQEDEPESHGRPLQLGAELVIPQWYRTVVETCLAEDPRLRAQAFNLLGMFPDPEETDADWARRNPPSISVDDGFSVQEYFVESYPNGRPRVRTVQPHEWSYVSEMSHTYVDPATGMSNEPYYYPTRGRSPPSPLPSNHDQCESPREGGNQAPPWMNSSYREPAVPSVSDATPDDPEGPGADRSTTPRTTRESVSAADTTVKAPESSLQPIKEVAAEPKGGETATPEILATEQRAQEISASQKDQEFLPDRSLTKQSDFIHEKQETTAAESRQEIETEVTGATGPEATEDGKDTSKHLHGAHSEGKPLFRDTGNTEPEVQQNSMENEQPILAQAENENQQIESASNNRVAQDERERARNTEEKLEPRQLAAAASSPSSQPVPAQTPRSPPSRSKRSFGSPGSDIPNDLIGCGSAHEASNEETLRSRRSLDDDFGMPDDNGTS